MTFYVINSGNSIHNSDNTTLGGNGLHLGAGDSAIIQANGTVLATGTYGTGIYVNAYAESSTLIVNGFVYGTSTGVYSLGTYAQITINGQVASDHTAIRIANSGYVYVSSTGVVSGSEGIAMSGSTVVNDGTINGTGSNGVQMSSGWLTNNGLISSSSGAIFYGGDAAGRIVNTGTIQGDLHTWYGASAVTAQLSIDNSGRWVGSLGLTPGDDSVANTGTITEGVNLGDGNNTLDSRSGFIGGDVYAGSGIDTILLGAGDTIITGGGGADTIDGGAGFDIASYSSSATGVSVNLLNGTASRGDAQGDHLSNIEGLYGTVVRDVLIGDNRNNTINGVLGGDRLLGNGGNDTIIMLGGGGSPVISGGAGNDLIQLLSVASATYGHAFNSAVQVSGGAGYDTLEIADAPITTFTDLTVTNIERLLVNDGFNYQFKSAQATVAAGARLWVDGSSLTGTNYIRFNGSAETNGAFDFTGGAGADRFIGGAGDDSFTGGGRHDVLTGGAGNDDFHFDTTLSASTNVDKITDFSSAQDAIYLHTSVFSALSTGALAAGAFRLGTAAADANDRIIYDSATGKIYYDADGSGAGAKVLFAQVTAGTTLTNADFIAVATATTTSRTTSAEKNTSTEWQASDLFSFEAEMVLLEDEFVEPAHMLAQEHWSQVQQMQPLWNSVDYFSA